MTEEIDLKVEISEMKFRMVGASPLLVHNEQLANPLNPIAQDMKKITSKQTKTPKDYAELALLEFNGGLYINDDGPYIPSSWIMATIREGAKRFKKGADIGRGVLIMDDLFYLETPGKEKTAKALWAAGAYDQRMVGNKGNRVLRTRPRFDRWALNVRINYMPNIISAKELRRALDIAGAQLGFGDFRPRFGRFIVE